MNKIEDLYSKIISAENIELAYLKIIEKFDSSSKSSRYSGLDGLCLNDYNVKSRKIIDLICEDLFLYKDNRPALKIEIPKKGKPGKRNIFVYPVYERIKIQAIYQILEPWIDKNLTRFLYSYRSTHPHIRAIKHVIRRYKMDYKESILVGDISNYTENIDHNILLIKLQELNIDKKTIDLLKKILANNFVENGEITKKDLGVLAGSPLSVLFFNLYLNDMDKVIGKKYSFYRRVGDDFIVFDNPEKLKNVEKDIKDYLESVKISSNLQKINILEKKDDFNFLGYRFNNGVISIPEKSIRKIKNHIRKVFRYYLIKNSVKLKRLKNIYYGDESITDFNIQIMRQYRLVNDYKQIKDLSDYFFIRMTIYFFGKYSNMNHRKTIELTRDINIPSFYLDFVNILNGRQTFLSLKNRDRKFKKKYV